MAKNFKKVQFINLVIFVLILKWNFISEKCITLLENRSLLKGTCKKVKCWENNKTVQHYLKRNKIKFFFM